MVEINGNAIMLNYVWVKTWFLQPMFVCITYPDIKTLTDSNYLD